MFVLLAILVVIVLTSVVAVGVSVHKDGYSRVPERKFVRSF